MSTLFALVASYQIKEQYNLDDPINNPYWKNKGGHDTVSSLFNLAQIMAFSPTELQAMVDADMPESDEYFQYTDQRWEILVLDSDLIVRVRRYLDVPTDDLGYLRHNFDGPVYAFDWAVRQEPTMLKDHWDSYNDRATILGRKVA